MTFYKEDGTTKIGEGGGVWLDIKNVKKMYLRAKAESQPAYPYGYVSDRRLRRLLHPLSIQQVGHLKLTLLRSRLSSYLCMAITWTMHIQTSMPKRC